MKLTTMYGFHDRIGLQLGIPFGVNAVEAQFDNAKGERITDFDSIHHRTETIAGLGDVDLGVQIGAIRKSDVEDLELDITLSVATPTGNVEDDPFELGRQKKKHQHMFFGTGTFKPRMTMRTYYSLDSWVLTGWATGSLALYENDRGYTPASDISGGIGAMSGFGLESWAFFLQTELFHEEPAKWNNEPAENSGRTALTAGVGIFYRPTNQWIISLLTKTPMVTWTKGDQFSVPFMLGLGVRFTADLLDHPHGA